MSVAKSIQKQLETLANDEVAANAARFFKTGPGEYSERTQFLGIRVPALRQLVKSSRSELSLPDAVTLLQSQWHETRLFALLAMVDQFKRGTENERRAIVNAYFKHRKVINNWDLVDSSAPYISGEWHFGRDRSRLHKMITARGLWDRRIAMLSTFYYIRQHDLDDTYRYAEQCLDDPEDLMHKATGWMLREAGKRDELRLLNFIDQYATRMPRTMLRYSIEKLSDKKRKQILADSRRK